jgi:hypothetical protein
MEELEGNCSRFRHNSRKACGVASADWFLLSAFPHPLSLGGLNEAFNDIADVRRHRNPNLQILGVIFTNVDGRATKLRAQLETVVSQALPQRKFDNYISPAAMLPALSGRGRTLFQMPRYATLTVATQYLRLSAEIEWRTTNRQAFLQGTLGRAPYETILARPRVAARGCNSGPDPEAPTIPEAAASAADRAIANL